MKDNVKRVFYVRYLAHPCYLEIIAQRPEIRLDKLENDADETGSQSLAEIKATAERRTHPTLLREDIDELDEKAARKSDVSELKGRVEKIETEKHGGDKAFRTLVIGALVSLTVSVSAAAILHAVFH